MFYAIELTEQSQVQEYSLNMSKAILKKFVHLKGGSDQTLDFPIQRVSFTEKTKRIIDESGVEDDYFSLVSSRQEP